MMKTILLKISRGILAMFVVWFVWVLPFTLASWSKENEKKDCCCCECPGYVKKDQVEYQYEQLIPPIHVEGVGFNGMILRDAIGTAFVITDDKFLHEVLIHSYNVGDTIR